MPKPFAIIKDENGVKRVVATTWLSDDLDTFKWPPFDDVAKVVKAVTDLVEPDDDWDDFEVTKFIRYKDTYSGAVADINLKLDEVTDASDDEKLKHSRASRRAKKLSMSPPSPKKSSGKRVRTSSDIEETPSPKKSKRNGSISEESSSDESTPNTATATTAAEPTRTSLKVPSKLALFSYESNGKGNAKTSGSRNDGRVSSHVVSSEESPRITEDFVWNPKSTEEGQFILFSMMKQVLLKTNKLTRNVDLLLKRNQAKDNEVKCLAIPSTSSMIPIDNDVCQHFPIDDKKVSKPHKKDKKDGEKESRNEEEDGPKSISVVEEKLTKKKGFFKKVVNWMLNLGGETAHELVYNIMMASFTNEVANKYSYVGLKSKAPFMDLKLNSCIFYAALQHKTKPSQFDIKKSITMWLDQSGTRLKREGDEKKGSSKKIFIPITPVEDSDDDDDTDVESEK
ncbi:hypothetical protein QAD02_016192 [Eretmocerus hayati]|uniref:Uncharacterized protein n=3 Tax=Eretmocerus hayati TaxID=131215 RepID=A0ACC2PAG5_9HYME|nr:hypothetical protein QAD02_010080 [Eretmocerus hayati]KAJ8676706.1 hypothetical protein QAD02_012493 [Eretmocerus hayati]KAJ8680405.1 hypothetical protein QAD02_016192 [Eretmocerus hayati]